MSSTRSTSSSSSPERRLRLAIIGKPIGHSLSPAIYNAALPAMGVDALYEAWETEPEQIADRIERLREPDMLGLNVTVPHKQAVMPLLDEIDPGAAAIGSVNCISKHDGRLRGHNTDKEGFIDSLRSAGFEPSGKRVVVLGAGGSARAVCAGLVEVGVAGLGIAGRREESVRRLANDLRAGEAAAVAIEEHGWFDDACRAAVAAADLVVNCTPIGMLHTAAEAQSPLPRELLRPGLWVYDLVYNPLETVLLREAKAAQAMPVGGLEMLVLQAAACVRLWTGREPPVNIMREAALAAMGGRP